MKIAVVTMVYRDYWALAQWYRHFGGMVGPEHLYIIAHGRDNEISRICPDASVVTIPRDDLNGFDRVRWRFLNRFQDALHGLYDRVVRTDADELICLDPERFASLADVFAQHDEPALFALGLDVVQIADRRWAAFSGHYSKAWTARYKVHLAMHGVRTGHGKAERFPFKMPQGVYLAHLKYANVDALVDANAHRIAIANGVGRGMPGKAWKVADVKSDQMLVRTDRKVVVDWAVARDEAYTALSVNPHRDLDDNLVRPRFLDFQHKSEVPTWILQPDQ